MGRRLAAPGRRAVRTDPPAPAWDPVAMTSHRKPTGLDLFIEAIVHPIRFPAPAAPAAPAAVQTTTR